LNYVGEFIAEVRRNKRHLEELFGLSFLGDAELTLREGLRTHWEPLPEIKIWFDREISVDSSSAQRSLSNGVDIFIARALMLGSDGFRAKKLRLEVAASTSDASGAQNAERVLRDLIEVEIILDNAASLREGDLVLVDGSIYGRLTHIMQQIRVDGLRELPLELYEKTRRLAEICSKRGVVIAGVSKFSKTRALLTAILATNGIQSVPPILDVAAIQRWMQMSPGFSTPLLLGTFALERHEEMSRRPERYINRFYPSLEGERREKGIDVIRGVPEAPAVAMIHIHLRPDEQPMRIDVPACCVASSMRIGDISPFRFTEAEPYIPIVSQLLEGYGGRDVYNALLYVADREVKLSEETVDTVYHSILSEELGELIEYDRSSRRFHE